MTSLLLRIFDAGRGRPWLLPLLAVLLLAGAAFGASRIRFSEDIFELLPQNEPAVAEGRLALSRFRTLERIVINLHAEDPQALAAAIDSAAAALRKIEGVASVTSRVNENALEDIARLYDGKLPLLFDAGLERQVEARLAPAEFQTRLQHFADRQAGVEGITVDSARFRRDPFALDELLFRRFERLNSGFEVRLAGGRLVSADGRHGLILAEADFIAGNTGRGLELMDRIDKALAELGPGVSAAVIGGHRSSVDNAQVLRADMHLTILTSLLGVLAVFLLTFRSLTPILAVLLSAGFGFAMALGAQGWTAGVLSAITAGFAAVLLGISVDYTIHLVTAVSAQDPAASRADRVRAALAHVAAPATTAMLTTVLAISTLWLSRLEGLRQLAEMAAVGVLAACAFALTLGGQLMARLAPRPRPNPLVALVRVAGAARERARGPVLALALLATLGLGIGMGRLGIDGDVTNLDGKSAKTRTAEAELRRVYGGAALGRTLLISGGDDLESALRANDLLGRELETQGVTKHESPAWVLPARQTQRENIERWRRFWSDDRIEAIKRGMLSARATSGGRELSFNAARRDAFFADFFAWVSAQTAAPETLDASSLRGRPLWDLVRNYFNEADGRVYVATTAEIEPPVAAMVRAASPATLILNKASFAATVMGFVRRDLVVLGGLSLALVALVLWLVLREPRQMLAALTPVAGGLVWTLGAMGWLGIPFNIINTLVTVFIAGLGIDYGIFVVQTWRGAPDATTAGLRMAGAGGGIMAAAITTLFGFGSLALASHPALFSVGITTVIGILSSLALALFVTPVLLGRGDSR